MVVPVHVRSTGEFARWRFATIEGDKAHTRFDQLAAHQIALATMAQAVAFAQPQRLDRQIESATRGGVGEHILRLVAQGHQRLRVRRLDTGYAQIERAEQVGPVFEAALVKPQQAKVWHRPARTIRLATGLEAFVGGWQETDS